MMKTVTYDEKEWVLVPIIPTEHQKQEGKRALKPYGDARDCYDAMIAAAPLKDGE